VQTATQFCFSFDFDEWAALAKADPCAFEARRLALIEDFLRQFPLPDQRRLRGLQFRIDLERQRARTPMAACLKLSGMMWDSLLGSQGLKRALNGKLTADTARAPAPDQPAPSSAQILPFRNPRR
jgi:hypothetical protein